MSAAVRPVSALLFLPFVLGCAGAAVAQPPEGWPSFIHGEVTETYYDGVADDLLTAGMGAAGLAGAAPALSNPPTAAELRRLAIYNNYRALVDMTPGGGYGLLYGPEGLIPGREYLALAGDSSGKVNVTLMVQVPDSFDPARPCIVAAPSSGSRGVYGAIGTAGEWGLEKGCAVAYTDKGTGTGAHDLERDSVGLIDGRRVDADVAGKDATFTAAISDQERASFLADHPYRFAFKHAHSQLNPEADWGRDVLWSIEFAFHVLARLHPGIAPDNTVVIASSVSNGGGASLRAAEQDKRGLIDGVAVSEPNVNPEFDDRFAIVQGDRPAVTQHSRSLLDYVTLVNVYQGCANLRPDLVAPLNLTNPALGANRCAALKAAGLLEGATVVEQAAAAQQILHDHGFLPEQDFIQPSYWFLYVPQAVAVTYAQAYGQARVTDTLCGYSFAAVDALGSPTALLAAAEQALFATANGIPPTGGVSVVNDLSVGGPRLDVASVSPSTLLADQNLDGALCLRALATGIDPRSGQPLTGTQRAIHEQITASIRAIRAGGDLGGLPAVVVTGRSDPLLPPNHTSRAYYGLNRLVEGEGSGLRYYEVEHAHHLDALNGVPGFSETLIPLHHYFFQAMDLMWAHLTEGTPLPPSQVISPTPRGIGAPPITLANLPPIDPDPPAEALITFDGATLRIPE